MVTETVVRKWGHSLGVILPKEVVEAKHLKEDDTILIEVVQKADLSDVFGSLRGKLKMSGQAFKDLAREGWMT